MSRNAWLTPDTNGFLLVQYKVWLPDDDTLRAAYRGALLLLEYPENWQEFGTATPEEIAARFQGANTLNFEMPT